jgi:hypothetical protein
MATTYKRNGILRRLAATAAVIALGASTMAFAQSGSMSDPRSSVSPAARAAFAERMQLIDAFMGAIDRGADAASVTSSNVVWMRQMLYTMSIEQLRSLAAPISYAQAARTVVQARDAKPDLGSFSNELVYYPITPCRYIDTRSVGGILNGTRTYDLAFTGGAFGGSVACDPKAAVGGNEDRIGALAINVAIVAPPNGPGFVGVRPAGSVAQTALVNWYDGGPTIQASNAGIVTTDQSGSAAEIEFFGSPTQFVVDVFGVFAAPSATSLDCVFAGYVQTVLNTTTRNFTLTPTACTAGYARQSVTCGVVSGDFTNGNLRMTEHGINNPGEVPSCTGRYTGAATVTVSAQSLCCRVPGR